MKQSSITAGYHLDSSSVDLLKSLLVRVGGLLWESVQSFTTCEGGVYILKYVDSKVR